MAIYLPLLCPPSSLSEFSDENMMEPYNLAICFGPTLLPIPEDKDQVQYQNLVNELMKHIILCHEEIFPRDGGPVYEKYISKGLDENEDIGEAPSEIASTVDDPDLELPSEDGQLGNGGSRDRGAKVRGAGMIQWYVCWCS